MKLGKRIWKEKCSSPIGLNSHLFAQIRGTFGTRIRPRNRSNLRPNFLYEFPEGIDVALYNHAPLVVNALAVMTNNIMLNHV